MSKNNLQKDFDNFKDYKSKITDSHNDELALFERFHQVIKSRANSHFQVSLNNLESSLESLQELKLKAKQIKDSLFYHEETAVIDRQEIITETESQVHIENKNILQYEYKSTLNNIKSHDYLNKALIQKIYDFFAEFKIKYASNLVELDDVYKFFSDKNKTYDKILKKYQNETLDLFLSLDNEINEMDNAISYLIKQKNAKLNTLNDFYSKETKSYLDNQLNFSVETNIKSEEIKSLVQDKLEQFHIFKKHLLSQEQKVREILHDEYQDIFSKVFDKLLQIKGNLLIEDPDFFKHVDESILKLKEEIVFAKEQKLASIHDLIKTYNKAIKYKTIYNKAKSKARKLTNKYLKTKKIIFFEYQKESRNLIYKIEKYYKLYLDLLRVDPFLAQIIGDNSTKIIKDEINYLSTSKINKEHKINLNFDLKTLKIKQEINGIEAKLIYEVERKIFLQDIDLQSHILDMQLFYIDDLTKTLVNQNHVLTEKHQIFRLENAINSYLKYDQLINNVNRKYYALVSQMLIDYARDSETHNIKVVEALSDIKLALKEYDIQALHFKTLFENEKRFLVMQSNRVSEESKIHNEFILTTYENQMRFAKEQISLADNEFRLRVEAIITAVDEEREYYFDIIENQNDIYKKKKRIVEDEYQAKLYHDSYLLSEATDKKFIKGLEKDITKQKNIYINMLKELDKEFDNNQSINDAKRRLRDLDGHLEDALLEATKLRDDTINEMQELYNDSKQKYDYLKKYLEQRVFPLEPSFYNALENSKKRLDYKIKVAEIELEDKTKDLLENYLNVYFEDKPTLNKRAVLENINQMISEKEQLHLSYQNDIVMIESEYQNTVGSLLIDKENIIKQAQILKDNIKIKEETTLNQKNHDLKNLEIAFEQQQSKNQLLFNKEIDDLTEEYNKTLTQSKKHINNLSNAFDVILKTYKPYLRLSKSNRKVKRIVKSTSKQIKVEKSKEIRVLSKDLRKQKLLINK